MAYSMWRQSLCAFERERGTEWAGDIRENGLKGLPSCTGKIFKWKTTMLCRGCHGFRNVGTTVV